MHLLAKFRSIVIWTGLCLGLAAASPALASKSAFVIETTPMVAGPGTAYKSVGTAVSGAAVAVGRCTGIWCQIDTGSANGWIALSNLSFGQRARGLMTGPIFNIQSGDGEACLYANDNYTGKYLCGNSGYVITDLALVGLDNTFKSVTVADEASILVCRDLNFASYCELLTKNSPKLSPFLRGNVSSIRVY